MNRAHDQKQAKESLMLTSRYFENISVDLIYGIPHLNEQRWLDNLKQTFDLGVVHISSYALTVEPKTALDHFIRSGKYPPLDESLAKRHFKSFRRKRAKGIIFNMRFQILVWKVIFQSIIPLIGWGMII